MSLDGRTALITGGGRGIGRAIALGLADDGADVAITWRRDEEAARETVVEIEKLERRGVAYQASVDVPEDCERVAAQVLGDFGAVDILVNNAGIASRGNDVVRTDPAEMERLYRVNVLGPFLLCKLLLPAMRERPRGDIVMISSVATVHLAGWSAPYNTGKSAMEALASTLAKEERRHGIHVNVVAPGLVVTEMGRRLMKGAAGIEDIHTLDEGSPFGHVCTPEEVADVVRFLVSDAAGYLTDQKLVVDGGSFQ